MNSMNTSNQPSSQTWALQDAKAQFSALFEQAFRGTPQRVTRRGKDAVVIIAASEYEALQATAAPKPNTKPLNFIEHLMAIPKLPDGEYVQFERLSIEPRAVDFS
jgi:prevent-host-death family protein